MNKLLKQLKRLKHDPRLGALDDAAMARGWAKISEAIGANEVSELPGEAGMWIEYLKWHTAQFLSKPVMAGAFSLAIVAGGWITTVNAADSLPGEKLYSVKMLTEKAQLKLASLDRRAVLHTEFAGRRLQEATDLQGADDNSQTAELVRNAIEAYKQEVASAGDNLRQLKDEGGESALATASSVSQNLQDIGAAIDQVVADSASAETTQDVLVAKEVTSEVSDVATTVVVEVHEEQQSALSERELKQMFKTDLGQVEARQRFDLERLDVIRAALADETIIYVGFTVPDSTQLLGYEYPIVAVDSLLSQAMNHFAIGGFRSAFKTLQDIETSLLAIEAELAQIEITIMNARAQTPVSLEVEPDASTVVIE